MLHTFSIVHFLTIHSTPYIGKWTNIYTQYLIDYIVELIVVFMYYMCHMISAFFYIGLCFYVTAMRNDLKLRMKEIHGNVNKSLDDTFKQNLFTELQFHARIFE